jgi:hypothetical protein
MKKYFLYTALILAFNRSSTAQILCVTCYNQNDSISWGVNNLLLNGGFENTTCIAGSPDCYCPNSMAYNCSIADWQCTGGGSLTYASIFDSTLSFIPQGIKAAYFGNAYATVCTPNFGENGCLYNIGCGVSGFTSGYPASYDTGYGGDTGISLFQTVSGLIPGQVYVLEFWTGGEPFGDVFINDGVFAVDIGFGNLFLPDKATPSVTGVGTVYIIQFMATSSSHTIKFTNWGHICPVCTELVLDNVRLYRVEELSKMVFHCATEINEDSYLLNIVSISPNPARSSFTISLNDELSIQNAGLKVYDTTGREIYTQQINNQSTIINNQFSAGVYFVKVQSGEKVWTEKLVVE